MRVFFRKPFFFPSSTARLRSQKKHYLPSFQTYVSKRRINGFHIDPYHGEEAAEIIASFFEKCADFKAKAEAAKSHDGSGDNDGGNKPETEEPDEDDDDDDPWLRISNAGLKRIASRYTWPIYACRLATLTSVYAFWKRSGRSRLLSSLRRAHISIC